MRKPMLALFGVAAVVALSSLACGPVSGDTDKAASGGQDLQGTWAQKYQIPLQRSARDAGKELLTEAEVAQREAERDKPKPPAPLRGERTAKRGTLEDLSGAYDTTFEVTPETKRPIGRRTSLVVDPPDGKIPPQTAAVQKRMAELRGFQLALMQSVETCKHSQEINCYGVKYTGTVSPRHNEPPPSYLAVDINGDRVINRADGPEDYGLGERCLAGRLPVIGALQRIVQSPDSVSILYEGFQRVIPITTNPHLPPIVRQRFGDARGHWEGNTLVVDVTNFTAKTDFQGSRENLHLIERFTRTDANTLEYVVRIEDPTAWEKPWTVKVDMAKQDDKPYQIYNEPRCHDGNYALMDILVGARMMDQAFAEHRGPDPATQCILICGQGNPEYAVLRMRGRGYAPVDGTPQPTGRK